MLVFVLLRQVQPYTSGHQQSRHPKPCHSGFMESNQRDGRTEERRRGKIGARAAGAQPAQGDDKQHQAEAVAEQTERHRLSEYRRRREYRAQRQRHHKISDASDETFCAGDKHCVGSGYLACEVVIQRPAQTSARNCDLTEPSFH